MRRPDAGGRATRARTGAGPVDGLVVGGIPPGLSDPSLPFDDGRSGRVPQGAGIVSIAVQFEHLCDDVGDSLAFRQCD